MIDEKEADAVHEAFTMYSEGKSLTAIAVTGALPTLLEAVQIKEHEKALLNAQLTAQKKNLSRRTPSADFIRRELGKLRDRLILTPDNEKALIHALVKRVDIKKDKFDVEIILHIEFVIAENGSGSALQIFPTILFAYEKRML